MTGVACGEGAKDKEKVLNIVLFKITYSQYYPIILNIVLVHKIEAVTHPCAKPQEFGVSIWCNKK